MCLISRPFGLSTRHGTRTHNLQLCSSCMTHYNNIINSSMLALESPLLLLINGIKISYPLHDIKGWHSAIELTGYL